ncbi:MAG: site-specific integrase [Gemmataceae bacterium]
MPRPRKPIPTPRRHKNAAVLDLYDGTRRRTVTLGPWGSDQASREYARLVAELGVSPHPSSAVTPAAEGRTDLTVNEVLLVFLKHADGHYVRPDGTRTHEVAEYRLVARYVRELYGHTPAAEFGPLALKALRQAFVTRDWCRRLVNQRVNRVRRVFKWAAGEELVAFAVYQRLTSVAGLQKGRASVREAPPVGPVAADAVAATLPHLRPEVAAMVQLQLLTGMRPGEACALRPCDIDRTDPVWLYRPPQHKTGWRGKARVIAIGPRAQAILAEFEPAEPTDHYFSPRRAVARLHAERAAARKTPRYPSHVARNARVRVAVPKRRPAERYDGTGYGHAVTRAVEMANERRGRLAGAGNYDAVPHWHPNQLRHTHGTVVRHRYGLEGAQVALGHERADVTQVYAERNSALAIEIAAEIG